MTRTPSTTNSTLPPAERLDPTADLETVLAAWHAATVRLEKTHETLRAEVRRLTDELTAKNRELARKNRLADLGQMASHVAHEVRNNLVPVTLYLSLLRRRLSDDLGSMDVLEKIDAGFTALDATVNDLLHFTTDRDPQWQEFNVGELIHEIFASLAPQFAAQGIEFIADVPHKQMAVADRAMLRRALLNLTLNALDAMHDGGELLFTVVHGPQSLEIEVADTGDGMSDDALRRALEPFFTTKGNGTGLGLAIVDRIAEVHGGRVFMANCPDHGAAVTIRLPQEAQTLRAAA